MSGGILSWGGYCPGGYCPGRYCPGGYCPRTIYIYILDVIQIQEAYATIIAPVWPAQSWFKKLVTMSVQLPVPVPKQGNAVLQIGPMIPEPLKNRIWRLYFCRICRIKD